MIGIDSNVLVRYMTQDDARQSAQATRFIERQLSEKEPGYISVVVLIELWWVLRKVYGVTAAEIRDKVRHLTNARQVVMEQRSVVARVLDRAGAANVDFADALIVELCLAAGCDNVVSFDKGAVKAGMKLLA